MKKLLNEWKGFLAEQAPIQELIQKGEDVSDAPSYCVVAYGKHLFTWKGDDYQEVPEQIMVYLNRIAPEAMDPVIAEDEITLHELAEAFREEERSDVLIGVVKDGELSIYDTGVYQLDPKSSVLVKKVAKHLNITDVWQTNQSTGNETHHHNREMTGKVAKTVYHGTSSDFLPGIMKFGLTPNKPTNYPGIQHKGLVFFTSDYDNAAYHAWHTSDRTPGDPAILQIKIPDMAKLEPDYDIDGNSSRTHYNDIGWGTYQSTNMSQNSTQLSREFGIYGYKGRIPASHIESVAVLLNASDYGYDWDTPPSEYTPLSMEELKTYLYTKENFGYGDPYYEEEEEEDEDYMQERLTISEAGLLKEVLDKINRQKSGDLTESEINEIGDGGMVAQFYGPFTAWGSGSSEEYCYYFETENQLYKVAFTSNPDPDAAEWFGVEPEYVEDEYGDYGHYEDPQVVEISFASHDKDSMMKWIERQNASDEEKEEYRRQRQVDTDRAYDDFLAITGIDLREPADSGLTSGEDIPADLEEPVAINEAVELQDYNQMPELLKVAHKRNNWDYIDDTNEGNALLVMGTVVATVKNYVQYSLTHETAAKHQIYCFSGVESVGEKFPTDRYVKDLQGNDLKVRMNRRERLYVRFIQKALPGARFIDVGSNIYFQVK